MDILFLALIAFYIFFRLKNQLGNVDEREKKSIRSKLDAKMQEIQREVMRQTKDAVNKSEIAKKQQVKNQLTSGLDSSNKDALEKILAKTNITLEFFVEGAKSAFEMVLMSFSKDDSSTLKTLLSPKILGAFENSIKERAEKKQKLVTNLISIKNVEVAAASINGENALIKLNIFSKQINYILEEDNKIVTGTKDQIDEMSDVWTFSKDLNSTNPNWQIIATN